MGIRSSYKVGACKIIPAVPARTANVKIHKKSLSSTIATYFQSSLTYEWYSNIYILSFLIIGSEKNQHTFVESSCILVCSAINRTQKQLRCTLGGHFEWEKAGLFNIGLFIPVFPISKSGTAVKSSELECVSCGKGPCTWQLPPKGPVLVRLIFKYMLFNFQSITSFNLCFTTIC